MHGNGSEGLADGVLPTKTFALSRLTGMIG